MPESTGSRFENQVTNVVGALVLAGIIWIGTQLWEGMKAEVKATAAISELTRRVDALERRWERVKP